MADKHLDSSEVINELRIHGSRIISESTEQAIRDYYNIVGPFEAVRRELHRSGPLPQPTRRQRLRLRWRDFRWWLGHKIVGDECREDDW